MNKRAINVTKITNITKKANIYSPDVLKKYMRREISRLSSINPRTKGLRVAIPRTIIEELDLKFQDLVEWEVSKRGDKKFAYIRKLE